MKFLAFAAALLMPALSLGSAVPPPQEEAEVSAMEIVGGTPAAAGEFPYIVSLQSGGRHFCGGALLNAYTVVTAAHCSTGTSPSSVRVRAGTIVSFLHSLNAYDDFRRLTWTLNL
jgi:trypsin